MDEVGAQLIRYDAMCRAIADAYEVDEVKSIRDKAMALEFYARQSKNTEAERQACEIRLRAERRAGELLKDLEKAVGGGTGANQHRAASPAREPAAQTTLADMGISKKQSANWQKLASVPQEIFDDELKHAPRPTTSGIIKAGTPPKQNPVDPKALWLWGRLHDFESDLLELSPSEVIKTLTPKMLDDVHRLAPRLANWLKRIGDPDEIAHAMTTIVNFEAALRSQIRKLKPADWEDDCEADSELADAAVERMVAMSDEALAEWLFNVLYFYDDSLFAREQGEIIKERVAAANATAKAAKKTGRRSAASS